MSDGRRDFGPHGKPWDAPVIVSDGNPVGTTAAGEWGSLPGESCRFCRQTGGVHFLIDAGPEGRAGHQPTRCEKCGRSWEAGEAMA